MLQICLTIRLSDAFVKSLELVCVSPPSLFSRGKTFFHKLHLCDRAFKLFGSVFEMPCYGSHETIFRVLASDLIRQSASPTFNPVKG